MVCYPYYMAAWESEMLKETALALKFFTIIRHGNDVCPFTPPFDTASVVVYDFILVSGGNFKGTIELRFCFQLTK